MVIKFVGEQPQKNEAMKKIQDKKKFNVVRSLQPTSMTL